MVYNFILIISIIEFLTNIVVETDLIIKYGTKRCLDKFL